MIQMWEGNSTEVEAFALSAMDMVLLLFRGRKDAALRDRCQKNMTRLTVLLHLLRTLDGMCGSEGVRDWQIESVLKLRLALWVSFKTEFFTSCVYDEENAGQLQTQLVRSGREEESRLARDIFVGQAGSVCLHRANILAWFVSEILLPFCCCWRGAELWGDSSDQPFFVWALKVLNNAEITPEPDCRFPSVKQRVVEMIVLLGGDAFMMEKHRELFSNVYLHTLIASRHVHSSPELILELTGCIRGGVMRGEYLSYKDLCLLLDALRHHVSIETDDVRKREVQTAVDILLNTACPPGGDKGTTCGVEMICSWFELLDLQHNYRSVLLNGAIDGKVLRSSLSLHGIQQIGIDNEVDAAVLLRVLNAHPQKTTIHGE